MKISEEDISSILVTDLPPEGEYRDIMKKILEAGRLSGVNSTKFLELHDSAWAELRALLAQCIARGMRLERQRSYKL